MITKAALPLSNLQDESVSDIIKTYYEYNHLKQLYRQGWLKRGIDTGNCESVAEHSFGVAVLAVIIANLYDQQLDGYKLLKMALFHDFGEIYAGDLTPGEVSGEEHLREWESVNKVFGKLADGPEYLKLWKEYEAGLSAEAKLIKQLDGLEMVLQASVYESQNATDLSDFFNEKQYSFGPELKDLFDQLLNLREKSHGACSLA